MHVNKNKNINICETLNNYEEKCIYFCDPIKNNIINDGNFIRILYSKSYFILNGIYLYFSLDIQSIEKYYNKLKCNFNTITHIDIIEKFKFIENNILKKINLNKIPQYKLAEQLKNGNVKIFDDLNLCTFKTTTSHAVITDKGDADCALETRNGLKDTNTNTNINTNTTECFGKNDFILKISGIWENELYYGLTFKFIKSKM
jgi:hypothetical protein